jgi:hypothetical protein
LAHAVQSAAFVLIEGNYINKMVTEKVSLEFKSYSDSELAPFGAKVAAGLTKNPAFPNPPVPGQELAKRVDELLAGMKASIQGSVKDTASKNSARQALVQALRQDAYYVQSVHCPDLNTMLTTGFIMIAPTPRTAVPLEAPRVTLLNDAGPTRLRVQFPRVPNARSFQVQSCVNGSAEGWKEVGLFNSSRGILLENLTPGTIYNVRVRAIGGSKGASDWSEPASRMCA